METKVSNRKAYFDYKILEEYCAGICLEGSEVKSIKDGRGSLVGAFCYVENNEVWLIGSNIPENEKSSFYNHEPERKRKLLLTGKEIKKITKEIEAKGKSLVPLEIFLNDTGFLKLKIGVVQGKKNYDKRESQKEKDAEKEIKDYDN